MKRTLALTLAALVALMAACTPYANPLTRNAEIAWLAMDLVDTAQTVTMAQSPDCLYEKDPLARMLYGTKHPSVVQVVGTGAALAAVHWELGALVDRAAEREGREPGRWYAARIGYYALSFMGTGSAVVGNVMLGVRPLAGNVCK